MCTEENKRKRQWFYLLIHIYLLVRVILVITPTTIWNYGSFVPIELAEVVLGYDIFQKYKKGISRAEGLFGLLIYFAGNIIRTLLQYRLTTHYGDQGYLLCWNTLPSMFCGAGLTIFVLSINADNLKPVIRFLSNKTLGIYFIHWCVIRCYLTGNVFALISRIAHPEKNTAIYTAINHALVILAIYTISLIIICVIHLFLKIWKYIVFHFINTVSVITKN